MITKKLIDAKQVVNACDLAQLDWHAFPEKENTNKYFY